MIYALQVELTKKELDSIRKDIARQNSVFSDKKYLDSLYLPSNIIGRQNQAKQLLQYFESLKQGFVVPLISVYGRSGAGKSTIVRFVCQNVQDVVSSIFVNLRKSKTIFGCTNLILSELGSEDLKSSTGLNKAVDKIRERIEEILEIEDKKFFVLVLDEYDVIFSDSRGGPSDFVYKLLTLEENLREKGLWLCIITISNNALSDYDLDDRVKSRMGNSEIFFAPYVKSEILEILRDRANHALCTKADGKVLELCAELSSGGHGDCRRAIDLLRVSAELANSSEITELHVKEAVKKLENDRIELVLANASGQLKRVIATVAKLVLFSQEEYHPTAEIYTQYMGVDTSPHLPLLSYRRVFDLLVEAQNAGLVVAKNRSRGRYGYATEYKLTAPTWMVGCAISRDWWYQQVGIKQDQERYAGESKKQFKPYRDGY